MENKNTYPIIKFPYDIEPYFRGEIPELSLLVPPKKLQVKFGGTTKLTIILVLIFVEVFILDKSIVLLTLGLLLISFITITLIGDIQTFNKQKIDEIKKYKSSIEKFQREIHNQNQLKTFLITQNQRNAYIQKRIVEIAKCATSALLILNNLATKGDSENFFLQYLKSIFGDNTKINYAIIENDWNYNYIPDFIFDDENLKIDIEIDEPYILRSLEPIHYYEIEHGKHIDSKRDSYFLSKNWFVVRFSELQIYDNPLGCCRIVANIVKVVTSNDEFINKLENIPKISKHLMWTYTEAKIKAKEGFRNSYKKSIS